jgi:hypothetical protein
VDGGKVVLCFVEFADARCAATTLEALQGDQNTQQSSLIHLLSLLCVRHFGYKLDILH